MPNALPLLVDLAAITVLVYPLYFLRHRRRDILLSFVGVNVGVLALAYMLGHMPLARTTGLGLGLIGVLRIIRLRSTVVSPEEIAYYLVSLSLGLLCGAKPEPAWLTPVVAAGLLVVVFVVDHPRLLTGYRQQELLLDRAFADEHELVAHLGTLLGADIHRARVRRLDLVKDTTLVDVRFKARPSGAAAT